MSFHRLHSLRMENDAAGYAMQEMRPRFDRISGRHENGTAPRAVSAHGLFQTPPELAERLVAAAGIQPGDRVLEPSAGLGRLLDALAPYRPGEVVAVEMSPDCARELYRREGVRLLQRDFLSVSPGELGAFDAVVMNPPFHMRADVHHIQHAMKFLRPGGRLAALCMDTHHREVLRGSGLWERIPGAFKAAGTSVSVILLTLTA